MAGNVEDVAAVAEDFGDAAADSVDVAGAAGGAAGVGRGSHKLGSDSGGRFRSPRSSGIFASVAEAVRHKVAEVGRSSSRAPFHLANSATRCL